MGQGAGL